MDDADPVALACNRGTPLTVYSERRLSDSAAAILASFRAVHPNSTACYAGKTCSAAVP